MATMTAGFEMMGTTRTQRTSAQTMAERNRELLELQRRARRGPTPEVFFSKHIDNSRLVKAEDPVRQREMRIFSGVMTILFALVMVYTWQHFSAIEIGYKVEAQKQQVEQLQEQSRQLHLSEAQLTEPARIDQVARQLGLSTPQAGQVVPNGTVNAQENGGAVMASMRVPGLAVQ
jgi:cell division protein FtsL